MATKEVDGIARVLIDMEMKMFSGREDPCCVHTERLYRSALGMGLPAPFVSLTTISAKNTGQSPPILR